MTYLRKAKEFIQANWDYYQDKWLDSTPLYIKEQVAYRLTICKDDCVKTGYCIVCDCPTHKKAWAETSCSPKRFPDRLDKESWEKYKKENEIY